jgi:hypothetical protein
MELCKSDESAQSAEERSSSQQEGKDGSGVILSLMGDLPPSRCTLMKPKLVPAAAGGLGGVPRSRLIASKTPFSLK